MELWSVGVVGKNGESGGVARSKRINSVTLDLAALIQFKVALVEKYLMQDNLTKSKKSPPKPFPEIP